MVDIYIYLYCKNAILVDIQKKLTINCVRLLYKHENIP